MDRAQQISLISARLNGQGKVIVDEAEETGLGLTLACALVEQESGGQNIFGCDHGPVGDKPPFCHQPVTKQRVQQLRARGTYKYGMNGIGLCQITWWSFVERAEHLGGAHLPKNQCRVGFRLLAEYLSKYPYLSAIGAYNAGETNRNNVPAYSNSVAAKHEAWKKRLEIVPAPDPEPDPEPKPTPGPSTNVPDPEVVFRFIRLASGLYAPGYRYTGGRSGETYEYCVVHGVDCSGMIDVIMREMGLKGSEHWGTVRISQILKHKTRYNPKTIYPPGTVVVNDNAVAWNAPATDNSHVGVIWGRPSPRGQLIVHSIRPTGVEFKNTDVQAHQWARWEWAGFLPGMVK